MKRLYKLFKFSKKDILCLIGAGLLNMAVCVRSLQNDAIYGSMDYKYICTFDLLVQSEFYMRSTGTLLFCVVLALLFGVKTVTFSENWVLRYGSRHRLWMCHCKKAIAGALCWNLMLFMSIMVYGTIQGMPLFNWNLTTSMYYKIFGTTSEIFWPLLFGEAFWLNWVRLLIPLCFILVGLWLTNSVLSGLVPSVIYGLALELDLAGFLRVSNIEAANHENCITAFLLWIAILVVLLLGCLMSRKKEFYEHTVFLVSLESVKKVCKTLLAELKMAAINTWWLWIPAVLVAAGSCMEYKTGVAYTFPELGKSMSVGDYVLYIFRGTNIFVPESGMPFILPAQWMLIVVLHLFYVGFYLRKFSGGWRMQTVLRTGRALLFYQKTIFIFIESLFYVSVYFCTACLYSGKNLSLSTQMTLMQSFLGVSSRPSAGHVIFWGLVMPFLVFGCMGLFMLVISQFAGIIAGFVLAAVLYVVSVYFFTPLLIGNCGMVLRSELALSEGISSTAVLVCCGLYIVVLLVVGTIKSARQNIL